MTGKYERLTALMLARLRDLDMKTWRDLSTKAGISYETLRALRAGSNPSDGTVYALEKALRWEPGTIPVILAGGEPTLVAEGRTQQEREARSAALDREMNEERERLRELTEKLENGDLPLAAAYLQGLIDRSAG